MAEVALAGRFIVVVAGWLVTVYPVMGVWQVCAGFHVMLALVKPLTATGSGIMRGGLGSALAYACAWPM